MVSIKTVQARMVEGDFERVKAVKQASGLSWDDFVLESAECFAECNDIEIPD